MKYDFYLAGPFFNDQQKSVMAEAKAILIRRGFSVCDPQEIAPVIVDLPEAERKQALFANIFAGNIQGMIDSQNLAACIDERDTGTSFELGYFFSLKQINPKREIYTFSSAGKPANVMLSQAANGHAATLKEFEESFFKYKASVSE